MDEAMCPKCSGRRYLLDVAGTCPRCGGRTSGETGADGEYLECPTCVGQMLREVDARREALERAFAAAWGARAAAEIDQRWERVRRRLEESGWREMEVG